LGKAGDRAIDEGYRRNAARAGVPVQPKRQWARKVLALKMHAARAAEKERTRTRPSLDLDRPNATFKKTRIDLV
jgi:hypothetical protein